MMRLGLERAQHLLAHTAMPWNPIHVAGTNGKGSVCAYISEMLNIYNRSEYRKKTGQTIIKHGRFTSPHLIDRWDCVSLSNPERDHCEMRTVSQTMFEELDKKVLLRDRSQRINATEFELLTATAFSCFSRAGLDIAVVETGMGGRLDATNIIGRRKKATSELRLRRMPLVTTITKIGMDHQAFLGDTISAIAREKAGILKAQVPVVYDASNPDEAIRVIIKTAQRARCKHIIPAGDRVMVKHHRRQNTAIAFESTYRALVGLGRIPELLEEHIEEHDELVERMKEVYQHVRFPGRLEYVDIGPLVGGKHEVLLDGAHNAQSAEVLAGEVDGLVRVVHSARSKNITWVLAASDGKDIASILSIIIRPGDSVFAVEFGPVAGMPWVQPMKASTILSHLQTSESPPSPGQIQEDCGDSLTAGIQKAAAHSRETGNGMVMAGSLYLVGDVHRLLRNAKE
ncbi:bifunctional [Lecanosticta acicola]|uniref:Bifunctional n=1 Tax=Lecanosticta acicola TaxID=111012 RepID=A0AAI8YZW5_9PEZI|nr:bifunctional [Lecanosticta acicola]